MINGNILGILYVFISFPFLSSFKRMFVSFLVCFCLRGTDSLYYFVSPGNEQSKVTELIVGCLVVRENGVLFYEESFYS